jgi:hypothetical protein
MKISLIISIVFCAFSTTNVLGQNTEVNKQVIDFTITQSKEKNTFFKWVVSNETHIQRYEIQEANNGEAFKTIAIVFTEELASTEKSYSFSSKFLLGSNITLPLKAGVYRIKIVDEKENTSYSVSTEILANDTLAFNNAKNKL